MTSLAKIGERLRAIRKSKHLTAPQLAEICRMHPNTLRAFETGKGNLELSRLLALCDSLSLELVFVPKSIAAEVGGDGKQVQTALGQKLADLMGA